MTRMIVKYPTPILEWLREGKSYQWIDEEYRRVYDPEAHLKPAMLSVMRRRHGIEPAVVKDPALLPWKIQPEHRTLYAPTMLRTEARRRAGAIAATDETTLKHLDTWIATLKERNQVVHYDPTQPKPWQYVPRRPGIDNDLIREPDASPPQTDVDTAVMNTVAHQLRSTGTDVQQLADNQIAVTTPDGRYTLTLARADDN